MMSGGLDMRIDNPKLTVPLIAATFSLILSHQAIGVELQNSTPDDIKVYIRGYDKNNKQKLQTMEIKANTTGRATIENCPTADFHSDKYACKISLSSEKTPIHSGTHIIPNNKEKDEKFKITISDNHTYELSPE